MWLACDFFKCAVRPMSSIMRRRVAMDGGSAEFVKQAIDLKSSERAVRKEMLSSLPERFGSNN